MAYSNIAKWWTNVLLVSLTINGYYPPLTYAAPSTILTSEKPIFTMPANADQGALLLPNIKDPESVNAQDVCPGYLASDVKETTHGFSATLSLAGKACNVYGTDVDKLNLTVEYQSKDRLNVNIMPAHITYSNRSHYILPDHLVPKPKPAKFSHCSAGKIDLEFSWSNEPSFSFKVTRRSTGDVLFDTTGTVLVFENQFVEFVSSLPSDYNLYGLGERIHGLRLGNNFTATIYAADVGDPIDTYVTIFLYIKSTDLMSVYLAIFTAPIPSILIPDISKFRRMKSWFLLLTMNMILRGHTYRTLTESSYAMPTGMKFSSSLTVSPGELWVVALIYTFILAHLNPK